MDLGIGSSNSRQDALGAVAQSPFDDIDVAESTEPMRSSVVSFWLGCFGLSFLAIAGTLAVKMVASNWNYWLVEFAFEQSLGRAELPFYWTHELTITDSLLPGLVLVAVVPLLSWRGGLVQRFAISIAIAITAMNVSSDPLEYFTDGDVRFMRLRQVVFCWLAIPILFWCTPLRTRSLRLIVAFCLISLGFCMSILPMNRVPRSLHVHSWQALYVAGFCFALLRRNWGEIAILERGATESQLERTSTKTLLELMAISGVGLMVAMFWSRAFDRNLLIAVGTSVVTGIMAAFVTIANVRFGLGDRRRTWKFVLIQWILFGVVYSVCIAFKMTVASGSIINYPEPLILFSISWGFLATLLLGIYTNLCILWLLICGWRINKR